MPIYEYECESCHETSEYIQKIADAPKTECEHCGGPLKKLVSLSSFQLKGSGWYVTDYAKGNGHEPQADGNGNGNGAAPSKAEKTEKSETKTETKKTETKSEKPAKATSAATDK